MSTVEIDEIVDAKIGPIEALFVRWMTFSPSKIVVYILAMIFSLELLIMFVLETIKIENSLLEAIVDSTSLTILVTLVFWRTIFSPFRRLEIATSAKAQRQIFDSRSMAETLFVNSPFGIARVSNVGIITLANRRFADLLGLGQHQMRGQRMNDILGESEVVGLNADFKKIVGEGLEAHSFSKTIQVSGVARKFFFNIFSIRGIDGRVTDILCMMFEANT